VKDVSEAIFVLTSLSSSQVESFPLFLIRLQHPQLVRLKRLKTKRKTKAARR